MGFSRQEYWSGLPFPALEYVLRMQQKESNGDRSDLDRIFLQRKAFLKINAVFELIYFFIYFTLAYEILGRRRWHPTPVLLPGESHGQRSLVGWTRLGE